MSLSHHEMDKAYKRREKKNSLLNWGSKFVYLEQDSEPFKEAWKAIQYNSMEKLKDSIKNMKKDGGYLDVCYLQSEFSLKKRENTHFYMTLLSYAAVHGQKEMVEVLLHRGASVDSGNGLSGSSLTQMMVYAYHLNCPEVINSEIVQKLISKDLDILFLYHINDECRTHICSPLDLALSIKRIDIARLLVKAGANKIDAAAPGDVSGVPSLLYEYYLFGTNEYIFWLLNQHLPYDELSNCKFIENVMKVVNVNESGLRMFRRVGRHPAHALLTCGNEHLVQKFLTSCKVSSHATKTDEICYECLTVKVDDKIDGRTALQMAAQNGDFQSVAVLLKFYRVEQKKEREDKALALLAAARKGNIKIVRQFLNKDAKSIMEEKLNELNECSVFDYAVKEGLTCVFEVLLKHHHNTDIVEMLTKCSAPEKDGNTLVHVAALMGNSRLFKAFFPLQAVTSKLRKIEKGHSHKTKGQDNPWAEDAGEASEAGEDSETEEKTLQREVIEQQADSMFKTLKLENREKKTPLHLAVDKNQLCILRTLQERVIERDLLPGSKQSAEEKAWKVFWGKWGPKLFIHACSNGSVDAVKVFIEMESPQYYDSDIEGETPLSAAARTGNEDTLQYLLSECKYSMPKPPKNPDANTVVSLFQHSPLLLAAEHGHAACVSILLKHEADVKQKSKNNYTCLMIAIKRRFRRTVMAILSDGQGFEALRCRSGSDTPMQMLIEHLPDVAEWVLDKCALKVHKSWNPANVTGSHDETDAGFELKDIGTKSSTVTSGAMSDDDAYEFLTFESSTPRNETDGGEAGCNWVQKPNSPNEIVLLMIEHNRQNLLNHFLVKKYVDFNWLKVGVPLLSFTCLLHLIFLVLLTVFALTIPRPAGTTCQRVEMVPVCNTANMTDEGLDTAEESGNDTNDTDALSLRVIIILICCGYLLLMLILKVIKAINFFHSPKLKDHICSELSSCLHQEHFRQRLRDILNFIHYLVLYICTIIFVIPGHKCWCFPSWKWQIGALAIFMAWVKILILLKDIPLIGKPITRLFNVYINFLVLIYLPIFLILTFAFPFYLLFINTVEETLVDPFFPTPLHAIWDVILQAGGRPNFQFSMTLSSPQTQSVMTYLLFITFIVAVPILFINFLIGEAVGEAEAEKKKAELSIIKSKIEYVEQIPSFLRDCLCCCRDKPPLAHDKQLLFDDLKQKCNDFLEKFEWEGDLQKKKLEKLQANMVEATKLLGVLEDEIKQCRKDIAKQKEENLVDLSHSSLGTTHSSLAPQTNGQKPLDEAERRSQFRILGEQLVKLEVSHQGNAVQPRGLINNSNWCYIHAPLQALLSVPAVRNLFWSLKLPLSKRVSATPFMDAMIKFVHEFKDYSGGTTSNGKLDPDSFQPYYMYTLHTIDASHKEQKDPEEFLGHLLNKLHEEMVSAKKAMQNTDAEDKEPVSDTNQENSKTESPITEIFRGFFQVEVGDMPPFFSIQLCIEGEINSVRQALDDYTTDQKLLKQVQKVATLPPVLILHLKRFYNNLEKNSKFISYTIEMELTEGMLAPEIKSLPKEQRTFKLCAVVYHHGKKMTGGHYTSDVYHSGYKGWVRMNDSSVERVPEKCVLETPDEKDKQAYLLFYRKSD